MAGDEEGGENEDDGGEFFEGHEGITSRVEIYDWGKIKKTIMLLMCSLKDKLRESSQQIIEFCGTWNALRV